MYVEESQNWLNVLCHVLLSRIILRNKIDHTKILRFSKQKTMHDDDDDGYESPARWLTIETQHRGGEAAATAQ